MFINENLTRANSKIAYHSRKLKRSSLIEKCYTREGVVHIVCNDLQNGKVIKVLHLNTLLNLFPNFDFGKDGKVEDHNDSIQSSYWIKSFIISCKCFVVLIGVLEERRLCVSFKRLNQSWLTSGKLCIQVFDEFQQSHLTLGVVVTYL